MSTLVWMRKVHILFCASQRTRRRFFLVMEPFPTGYGGDSIRDCCDGGDIEFLSQNGYFGVSESWETYNCSNCTVAGGLQLQLFRMVQGWKKCYTVSKKRSLNPAVVQNSFVGNCEMSSFIANTESCRSNFSAQRIYMAGPF